MNIVFKCIKHFNIITRHKYEVFKACCLAGIPLQGILHDLSKYTPSEFIEYAQYYNGEMSPVDKCKEIKGYCFSWLHHRGRNPHHYEYWIDNLDSGGKPLEIPYKYVIEMICDWIGAGKVYNKGKWTEQELYDFWQRKKQTAKINDFTKEYLDYLIEDILKNGVKKGLNKDWTNDAWNMVKYHISVY